MTEPRQEEAEPADPQVEWSDEDGEWVEVFDDEDLDWWEWSEE